MSNTEIWDKLKRVPPEHLKGFSRAGGFKGTAIKPMWSFHRMTEVFGPCGTGWGVGHPGFQTVAAGDEILVFCTVSVWYINGEKETQNVFGVGGDKVRVIQSSGPRNDDEAFKKAYTDAVTNALKLIGVGADVHMGLWDGNKYIDEKPEAKAEEQTQSSAVPIGITGGDPEASRAASRVPYEDMVKAIRNAATIKALGQWRRETLDDIEKLPPNFYDQLALEYNDRLSELKKSLAA